MTPNCHLGSSVWSSPGWPVRSERCRCWWRSSSTTSKCMGCTQRAFTENRGPPTRSRSCGKASIQVNSGKKTHMGKKNLCNSKVGCEGGGMHHRGGTRERSCLSHTAGCASDAFTSPTKTQVIYSCFFGCNMWKKSFYLRENAALLKHSNRCQQEEKSFVPPKVTCPGKCISLYF